jgi:peptidoglycan/LPS O-acetylase OafA/YrhL
VFVLHQGTFSSLEDGLTNFGLVQGYRSQLPGTGLGVAWTLVIEVSFYLVLPFLALGLRAVSSRFDTPRNRARALLGGLAVMAALSFALRTWWLYAAPGPATRTGAWFPLADLDLWLIAYLDWFALGMAMAVGIEWFRVGGRIPSAIALLGRKPWLAWLLAAECYWVLTKLNLGMYLPATRFTATQSTLRWIFTGLAAALFVLPAVFGPQDRGVIRRILRHPVSVALGLISYGIYLWHFPMWLQALEWDDAAWFPTSWPGQIAFVLAMTLAAAALSYIVVERPLISWSSRTSAPRLFVFHRRRSMNGAPPTTTERATVPVAKGRILAGAAVVSVALAGLVVAASDLKTLPKPDPFSWRGTDNAVVSDTFERPDQTGLGDTSSGQRWQSLAGRWAIADHRATVSAAETPSFAVVSGPGTSPTYVRAALADRVDYAGIAFRCRDAQNCWWLEAQPAYSTWNLQKVVAGEVTYVGNIGVTTTAPGAIVAVRLDGEEITISVAARVRHTVTDPDLAGERGVGLARGVGGSGSATWTRFEVS